MDHDPESSCCLGAVRHEPVATLSDSDHPWISADWIGKKRQSSGQPWRADMHHMKHSSTAGKHQSHGPYAKLAVMAILSFLAMYLLMYAMVDRWDNVFSNINQAYMAGLMAAPMVLIEL